MVTPSAENDRYGFLSSDGYPDEGPNPLIKPPPSAEKDAPLTADDMADLVAAFRSSSRSPEHLAFLAAPAVGRILARHGCPIPPGVDHD